MDATNNLDFTNLLNESVKIHGHLCPGQVLGVRMSMLGLSLCGISDPKGADRKSLVVFVEMDRCATDAVQSVTGCSLGKRSMKFMDYGKMAASFYNTATGVAIRIFAREEARDIAAGMFPEIENKYTAQLEAYKVMSEDELFTTMSVAINIAPEDMPGRPLGRVKCSKCSEHVQDMREVNTNEGPLCKPCAQGGYYTVVALDLPPVMQNPPNGANDTKQGIEHED